MENKLSVWLLVFLTVDLPDIPLPYWLCILFIYIIVSWNS